MRWLRCVDTDGQQTVPQQGTLGLWTPDRNGLLDRLIQTPVDRVERSAENNLRGGLVVRGSPDSARMRSGWAGRTGKRGHVMKQSSVSLRFVVALLVVLPVGYRAATWLAGSDTGFKFDAEMSQQGKDLFVHEWTPGDKLSPAGDGLGPVFNAKSCVECHNQGGAGGGGPLKNNVTAFAVAPLKVPAKTQPASLSQNAASTPRASEARQGVVHAFATSADFVETLAHISPNFPNKSQPELKDLLAPPAMSG